MNEVEVADSIKQRCQHLRRGCGEAGEGAEVKQWRKTRLDRMMVEYLLRQGYSTVQYSTVQYSGVPPQAGIQYSTVQYSIVQYSTVQ